MSKKRKTTTKKVKRRRLKPKAAVFLLCFFGGLFLIIFYFTKTNVTHVYVEGNDYLSVSYILKKSGLEKDIKFSEATQLRICKKLKDPLINTCKVKHHLNRSITVVITENKPLFFYTNENKLALSSGELLEAENTYGVPTLINYVPKKVLKKFITGLAGTNSDIIRSISEIEYSPSQNSDGTYIDEGRFLLSMNDSNTVYINIKHIDVLNYYEKVYASLGDKRGTYYFDCDFDNYYFEEYGK